MSIWLDIAFWTAGIALVAAMVIGNFLTRKMWVDSWIASERTTNVLLAAYLRAELEDRKRDTSQRALDEIAAMHKAYSDAWENPA